MRAPETETRAAPIATDANSGVPNPSLETLAAAFEHSVTGLGIADASGRLRAANAAFARMLGFPGGELLGRHIADVTHAEDRAGDGEQWARLARGEIDAYQREKRYLRKDGTFLWGLVTVSALRDGAGQFLGSMAQVQDITAQKSAESALRENEARLGSLLEQMPILLYRQPWGESHAITYTSPRFAETTGLTLETFPGDFETLREMVHPDDLAHVTEVNERANRTGETAQAQYRLRGGHGDWVWLDHRSVLLRDEAGEPLAWHGSVIDITERKTLEASLRESEERSRLAFENAAIGMALADPDDICIDVNEAYCAIVGVPREELLGRSLSTVTHPADRDAARDRRVTLASGEADSHVVEKRYLRPDGRTVTGRLTVSAVRDDDGSLRYFIGQLQDISAQEVAERALRESDGHLRSIVDRVPAAVYRLEPGQEGRFTFASPRFQTMTGLTIDNSVRTLGDFFARIHPDDRPAVRAADAASAGTGERFDLEYRVRADDGSWVWVHDRSTPARDADGQVTAWHGVLLDVSERKQLEEALRENEARLQSLIEHLPVALYSVEPTPGMHYTYTSPQFEALTGLTPEDLGQGIGAFDARIHPDDLPGANALSDRGDLTGETYDTEYRLLGANGEWRWMHDRAVLARDEQGKPLAWHGVLLDVSERERLLEALRENEARLRVLVEQLPVALFSLERAPSTRYTYVSPRFGDLTGMSAEEIAIGTEALFARIHPADVASVREADRWSNETEEPHEIEYRVRNATGEWVWLQERAMLARDEEGRPLTWHGVLLDISAQRRLEETVRESEARFRAVVQHDPDVVAIVNPAMEIVYISPSAGDAFGMPPTSLLGPIEDQFGRVHPEDQQHTMLLFNEVSGEEGAMASVEARIRHDELDWRWFQITITNRAETPGIGGYLFNLRDITERKQAELATEAALRSQQEAIDELERLSYSKSRFLSTISHEFRTPLTAIMGYSEFMTSNANEPALVIEDAATIHREASRLNRMIGDLLLIDRVDAGRLSLTPRPVDINALIETVAKSVRPLTVDHNLVLELDPDLHRVEGDFDRLAQALTNLLSNAVKYSPPGATITVTTGNRDDIAVVSVQDEGLGIAPEDQQRIFGRFERVESGIAGRVAGTGLGLSIVREIAHLHGGEAWVESQPGAGSRFSLSIPASRAGNARSENQGSSG